MTKQSEDELDYRQLWLRLDKLPRRFQAQAIRDEMKKRGIDDIKAVSCVVEEFLGPKGKKGHSEDQLRDLAATFAPLLGMTPDRFVALSRTERR